MPESILSGGIGATGGAGSVVVELDLGGDIADGEGVVVVDGGVWVFGAALG
ncbi:MAG: hypothetical protein GY698_20800 [Actinomycetia bacterium]|nr:hypothetical protein [Actinomycetes bacterium]